MKAQQTITLEEYAEMQGNGRFPVICGIDPGLNGGICVHSSRGASDYKMPVHNKTVDVSVVQDLLTAHAVDVVYIESQRAMARQAGQHLIGVNYGRLTATIELCGIRYVEVVAQDWQRKIFGRYAGKQSKEYSINFCLENGYFVPMTSSRVDANYHDGVADAHCIAHYGRMQETTKEQ